MITFSKVPACRRAAKEKDGLKKIFFINVMKSENVIKKMLWNFECYHKMLWNLRMLLKQFITFCDNIDSFITFCDNILRFHNIYEKNFFSPSFSLAARRHLGKCYQKNVMNSDNVIRKNVMKLWMLLKRFITFYDDIHSFITFSDNIYW